MRLEGDDTELVGLLNPYEASHLSNWAWDPHTGKMHPIDVEVIDISGEENQALIKKWSDMTPQVIDPSLK
jgi:predicted nuclease of predicted toxin-antitoxin system